jgi:hypothetical protein
MSLLFSKLTFCLDKEGSGKKICGTNPVGGGGNRGKYLKEKLNFREKLTEIFFNKTKKLFIWCFNLFFCMN